jgi:hypothetical protein
MDLVIAEGAEDRVAGDVGDLTQRALVSFDQVVGDNIAGSSRPIRGSTAGSS